VVVVHSAQPTRTCLLDNCQNREECQTKGISDFLKLNNGDCDRIKPWKIILLWCYVKITRKRWKR